MKLLLISNFFLFQQCFVIHWKLILSFIWILHIFGLMFSYFRLIIFVKGSRTCPLSRTLYHDVFTYVQKLVSMMMIKLLVLHSEAGSESFELILVFLINHISTKFYNPRNTITLNNAPENIILGINDQCVDPKRKHICFTIFI